MFYKTITGSRIPAVLIILCLALFIWLPAFLSPEIRIEREMDNSMPLFGILTSVLEGHVLLSKLFAFGLVLFVAFLLVRINAKFVLVQQRTFLPALFFIVIAGHSPVIMQWNPVLPSAVFAILVLEIIFRSYRDDPNSYRFFEAGILLGLGSLFYAPLAYLLLFIWFAGLVQRPFYWREYLFPVIGMLIPYVFVLAFLFFGDKSLVEFLTRMRSNFIFGSGIPNYPWINWIFAGYLTLLLLIAGIYMLKVFQFRKIYIRDYFMVLFILFIMVSTMYLFLSGFEQGMSYLVAISMSYILTNYFINAKKSLINKVLLYLFLGDVVFLAVNNLLMLR